MVRHLKFLFFLLVPVSVFALDNASSRQSLKGLAGVNVVVEKVSPAIAKMGVDPEKIQSGVEGKLRSAGIKVVSDAERAKVPGMPYLAVNINALEGKTGVVSFGLSLALYQGCKLARDAASSLPACDTWSKSKVGHANEKVGSYIQEAVNSEVDFFVKAYTEANPKGK